MKKNVMMRIAACLLVCVLASTCGISGTFAKYVTSDNADDAARVAKWGVSATVTGNAFKWQYEIEDDESELDLAVNSGIEDDDLVAPGTAGTFVGVALTGTPEVAVEITKTATIDIAGWMIDDDNDVDTPAVFYCPLVFTINGTPINGRDYDNETDLETALKTAIEAANGEYEPLTNLANIANMNGDYSWSWDFDDNGAGTNDVLDTILGNMVADGGTATISIDVEVTVTQVD